MTTIGYAWHKGHNAGLQGIPLTQRFNSTRFQRDFEKGYKQGLKDAEIFQAVAEKTNKGA